MKQKLIAILAVSILSIFLINTVSAIALDCGWVDDNKNLEIKEGESAEFYIDAFSMSDPMTITLKLFDSNDNLIHTFENGRKISSIAFSENYTVTEEIYTEAGEYTIVFIGSDKFPSTRTCTISLTVTGEENQAPVITSTPITEVNEGEVYTYKVEATDADNDELNYFLFNRSTIENEAEWISIDSTTGLITGTAPHVDSDTSFNVEVGVSDGENPSTFQKFTITVKNIPDTEPENNAPVITSTPITKVNESSPYTYQVIAEDADEDSLTYTLINSPDWLSMDANGLITGTAQEVSTDYKFLVRIKVSDGEKSNYQVYYLEVKDISSKTENNKPVITSTPIRTVDEGKTYRYRVEATDADNDELTFELTFSPDWLSINSKTGLIMGKAPSVSEDKEWQVRVKVSDEEDFTTQVYTLTVEDVPSAENNAPVITSTPITEVNESSPYTYQVIAEDADNDDLKFSLAEAPEWLSINPVTGFITGTAPETDQTKTFTIEVRVSDGEDTDSQVFTITVLDEEDQDDTIILARRDDDKERGPSLIQYDEFYTEKYLEQFNRIVLDDQEALEEDAEGTTMKDILVVLLVLIVIIVILSLITVVIQRI